MKLYANWTIAGIVKEKRQLTSQKNKDWRGYIIKIATLGDSFELQADLEQFNQIGEGEHIEITGEFEEQNGKQRFIIKNYKPVKVAA